MDNDRKSGDRREEGDLRSRLLWFASSRVAGRERARDLIYRGLRQRRAMERKILEGNSGAGGMPGPAGTLNWTPIGPSAVAHGQAFDNPRVSGRINALAIGPGGNRAYVGAANGGIWGTVDGTNSWRPLNDYATSPGTVSTVEADSMSVGALAVTFGSDPMGANDEIYVGTGEPFPTDIPTIDGYFGIGVRHSANGGGAWGALEATNLAGVGIFRITIDPVDPTVVLVAASTGLFRRPAGGGPTYTAVAGISGAVCDLVVAGKTVTTRTYYAAVWQDRVYSSPDGTKWNPVPGLTLGGSGPHLYGGRIALAVCESDPTVAYALVSDGRLFRLVNGTFQLVTGMPNAVFPELQGWYDIAVAVDPANANIVYLGGDLTYTQNYSASLYRGSVTLPVGGSPNFGSNSAADVTTDPTWVGEGVHADIHALAFALDAAGTAHDGGNVWVGCDGGLFQSSTPAINGSFVARNTGLAITETYYLAQHPVNDAVVFAGTQDNGTVRCWGDQAWYEQPLGDGGGVAIDPNTPTNVMRQYVRTILSSSNDGGSSAVWNNVTVPFGSELNTFPLNFQGFIGPIQTSPAGGATMVAYGTYRLWVSTNWGGMWVTLPTNNNPYTSGGGAAQDSIDGSAVRAIAFASADRIYVATQSTLWRIDRIGGVWQTPATNLTAGLPAGHLITSIAVESTAGNGTIYVTLGGSGYAHVWYHDGNTNTWTAAMPQATLDVPMHGVVVDPANPNNVYVGTDVGCFKGVRTGANAWAPWQPFSFGLPEAAIIDMKIHAPTRLLRASTHGRGVWEVQLDAPPPNPANPDVYLRVNYADTGRLLGPGGSRYAFVEGAADPTAPTFQVWHWMSADIKVRRPNITPLPPLGASADYVDFENNIGDWVDSVSHIETADDSLGTSDRIFVQVHNRNPNGTIAGNQVKVLLLLTDASGGLPPLPANYATHINNLDTNAAWLAGTPWVFADPLQPFKSFPGTLDVRTPQVAEFQVDFAARGFGASTHVCAAAFITTSLDQITSTNPSLDFVTMNDKHIAHRNLHLITTPTSKPGTPAPPPGAPSTAPLKTFLLDFHNVDTGAQSIEIELRTNFPGHLSLLLPKIAHGPLDGIRVQEHGKLEVALVSHLSDWLAGAGEWIEDLGERVEQAAAAVGGRTAPSDLVEARARRVGALDRTRVFMVEQRPLAQLSGIKLAPHGHITAAFTVQAPASAKRGDSYRLDVLQKVGGRVVGGSSYYLVVPRKS